MFKILIVSRRNHCGKWRYHICINLQFHIYFFKHSTIVRLKIAFYLFFKPFLFLFIIVFILQIVYYSRIPFANNHRYWISVNEQTLLKLWVIPSAMNFLFCCESLLKCSMTSITLLEYCYLSYFVEEL